MKYMAKKRSLLLLASLLVIFASCSTFLFQPVKKQIVGTWISDPVLSTTNPDTWTFSSNGTCTLVFHDYAVNGSDSTSIYGGPGYSSIFYEPGGKRGGDTTLSNVPYSITSSAGRYYLNIDAYATLMGYATNQFRFIIISVNSKSMYLESQILYNPAQTGYIQISFSKQ